jgi:ribosomal protein L13
MLAETEKKRLMRRLMIYSNQEHLHQAQNPIKLDLSNLTSSLLVDMKIN